MDRIFKHLNQKNRITSSRNPNSSIGMVGDESVTQLLSRLRGYWRVSLKEIRNATLHC